MPGQLSVSEVSEAGATLWWVPATPGSARIIGYRVYRDGALLGQTTQDSMRLTHLSSLRTYHLAVAAVDATTAKARARRNCCASPPPTPRPRAPR